MDPKINLDTSAKNLFMIGPKYAKRLEKLGIITINDLLSHFPFRYEDYSKKVLLQDAKPGETVTVSGTVWQIQNEVTKIKAQKITTCIINDGTGEIQATWFNQPFLARVINVGDVLSLSGKIEVWGKQLRMTSPEWEITRAYAKSLKPRENIHTARLVPVYPETYGVSSKWLRSRIFPVLTQCLPQLKEWFPKEIIKEQGLLELPTALKEIHFPKDQKSAERARERFAFEELFLLQMAALKRRRDWRDRKVPWRLEIGRHKVQINKFISALPFKLTEAQKRVVGEILGDLKKWEPMNRLLEGDVGSGKTVVAAIAMYATFLNGKQSVLMAPTEILAQQHFDTLSGFLKPSGVKIVLQTRTKRGIKPQPDSSATTFDVAVGTHALLSEKLKFERLALVVIDEQHRFGVRQRAKLKKGAKPYGQPGTTPHLLTLSATPIPRTVALTLYGDLDLSVLDEMPPGRQRVKTWVVPPKKREAAYDWIRKQILGTGADTSKKSQAFIICPLIEESESLASVKAAKVEYEKLKTQVFCDLKLGLLHGRMRTKQKDQVLDRFRSQELDILVATPVVEVGIDIPNATIMMIEGAERFGLAQLHQLRGRVGRGQKQSYCLLFTDSARPQAIKRLKAMETLYVGSQLAEFDLKMRGPGEIYGTAQHGFPKLKVASFYDLPLIKRARRSAQRIFETDPNLLKYPLLKQKLKKITITQVEPD